MACAPGTLVNRARADFGAYLFFHSASYQEWWIELGGIPVWRSPNQPGSFVDVAAAMRQQQYRGLVLLFNEPDIAGQDAPLSPDDAAALYRLAVALFPNSTFVTPNANSVWYLQRFLDAVGDDWRSQDRIGIHMYQPPTAGNAVDGWVFGEPTIWPAAWLAPVIDLAAARGSQIWVSEVGVSNEWRADLRDRYIEELLSSTAEVICWYTPHCGGYSAHACLHNLYTAQTGNPSLTPFGVALQAALVNNENE